MRASCSRARLLSATAIYTAGDFLTTAVSGFLLLPLYLRFMTPAEYGLYGTITAMTAMLGVLIGLGLSSAVGRFYFVYRESGEEYAYLGSIWLFQIIAAILICVPLAMWGSPLWAMVCPAIPFRPYIWFVLTGAILAFSAFIYPLWLRVQEKPLGFIVVQIAGMFSFVAFLGVLLVAFRKGAYGALLASLGSTVVLTMLSVGFLVGKATWRVRPEYVKPSLAYGGWMVVGTFGYFLLSKSQIFFVQHYRDLASAGVFNLGQQIGGILLLVSASFGKAWQPVLFSAASRADAAVMIGSLSKYYVAGMLFCALPVALFSGEILHVLARPGYSDAASIIRIVAIGSFFYVLSLLPSSGLLFEKRAGLSQIVTLLSVVINIPMNLLLIPKWGGLGAAVAVALSFLAMTTISLVLAHRVLVVHYDWRAIGKILFSGGVLVGIEWVLVSLLSQPAAFLCRLGLVFLFPVLLVLIGVIRPREIARFVSLAREWRKRLQIAK